MLDPSTATLGPSDNKTFSAQGAETWQINPPGVGTLTDGTYTAPSEISEKKQISIVAKDKAGAQIGRATVTLVPPLRVVPSGVDLTSGQQQQFNVEGAELPTVTWELNPPGFGRLQDGTYTAPSEIPASPQLNIIARDTASARTSHATVTLVPPLKVAPSTLDLGPGQQQQFNVEPVETVTWSLQQPKVGEVNESGVYRAPKHIFDQRSVVLTAKSIRQPPEICERHD